MELIITDYIHKCIGNRLQNKYYRYNTLLWSLQHWSETRQASLFNNHTNKPVHKDWQDPVSRDKSGCSPVNEQTKLSQCVGYEGI